MSTHKNIDKICCVVLAFVLVFTSIFMYVGVTRANSLGSFGEGTSLGYENRLFDTSYVHKINIEMDDWDGFIEECKNEEYSACTITIDGEKYANIGIRAKGNSSLTQVDSLNSSRYSFKVELDHYQDGSSYYGLDKFCLNNIIQDNTYMKDYVSYQLMNQFGVNAPLCSYAYITVNGQDWGLYLAVEGVEDSFLKRNYGDDFGNLYKPDSMNMGGGRGNGKKFNQEDMEKMKETLSSDMQDGKMPKMPSESQMSEMEKNKAVPDDALSEKLEEMSQQISQEKENENTKSGEGYDFGKDKRKDGRKGFGSDDVSLIYSDNNTDSYSNIFDNAKTDVTKSDKERLISSIKQMNEKENIEEVVDVEQVIRYFVVHNFLCNFDSYTGSMIHNYYLYEKDGKMSMIPWDYNLAFGGFMSGGNATSLVNYPIDSPVSGGTTDSRPMLAWIFSNDTYTKLYHDYFNRFIAQCFDNEYVTTLIEQANRLISPYVKKDPTKFCTYEEFESGVSTLEQFCKLRASSIKGQLAGTIPSTSDGQEENKNSLVDASSVKISDMGSQGGKGGFREKETTKIENGEDIADIKAGEARKNTEGIENVKDSEIKENTEEKQNR